EAWLKKTVLPLGQAGGKLDVVYIGTILHYDSVLSRTLNNKLWRTARFKALRRWPDNMSLWDAWEALLRNEGEDAATAFYEANQRDMDAGALVSWSARPLVALMTIRARDGHGTFDSEYQNDPVAGDDALFAGKDEAGHDIIKYWVHRMREWIYFGAVDPSLGKAGASRDPSAILVGGYDRLNGVLNVVEAQIRKRLPDKIISDVIELQKIYNCLVWGVESVQFQEFLRTELIKRAQLEGIPVPARSIIPHTDKLLRIESLQPHVANGRILLHADQTTLIEQLRHFPKADHDDGPDALHMLWTLAVSSTPKMEFYSMNSDMSRRASRDWQRDFHQGGW
uniref:phage terminase large subunit n=1 Tax=Rahnella sp. ChDrAdgB13 TaxID=1850581 RepID=UPI001AD86DA5